MNLPNKLTVLRLILIPFFLVLMIMPVQWGYYSFLGAEIPVTQFWAAMIFIVASITDNLDGQIARRQKLVTNFGKFADPLADKLLVMTAFILLVEQRILPAWAVSIIIWRELAITGLRLLVVEQNGQVMAAQMPGKIKTTTQLIAIIFLILNNIGFALINVPFGQIMFYICLFFTVYSGIDYIYQARSVFADGFK